ncbi:hypothetical protein GF343_02835 [Candidatus Woesearchaeota archaeon]|nr:hypothetical protein [Candidatus Woesearchaeota archaeon]
MAEFYGNGLESAGGGRSSSWASHEPAPKEKSLLETSLDGVQEKADTVLREALELAKSGKDRDKIEERIAVYQHLASILPGGPDEHRVEDVRKHFKYSVLVDKFQKRLKKRIFS